MKRIEYERKVKKYFSNCGYEVVETINIDSMTTDLIITSKCKHITEKYIVRIKMNVFKYSKATIKNLAKIVEAQKCVKGIIITNKEGNLNKQIKILAQNMNIEIMNFSELENIVSGNNIESNSTKKRIDFSKWFPIVISILSLATTSLFIQRYNILRYDYETIDGIYYGSDSNIYLKNEHVKDATLIPYTDVLISYDNCPICYITYQNFKQNSYPLCKGGLFNVSKMPDDENYTENLESRIIKVFQKSDYESKIDYQKFDFIYKENYQLSYKYNDGFGNKKFEVTYLLLDNNEFIVTSPQYSTSYQYIGPYDDTMTDETFETNIIKSIKESLKNANF